MLPYLNQNLLKIKETQNKVNSVHTVDDESMNDTGVVEEPPKNKKEKKERAKQKHMKMLQKSIDELLKDDTKKNYLNDRILNFLYHDVEKTKTITEIMVG